MGQTRQKSEIRGQIYFFQFEICTNYQWKTRNQVKWTSFELTSEGHRSARNHVIVCCFSIHLSVNPFKIYRQGWDEAASFPRGCSNILLASRCSLLQKLNKSRLSVVWTCCVFFLISCPYGYPLTTTPRFWSCSCTYLIGTENLTDSWQPRWDGLIGVTIDRWTFFLFVGPSFSSFCRFAGVSSSPSE